jgi:hypothetical protein
MHLKRTVGIVLSAAHLFRNLVDTRIGIIPCWINGCTTVSNSVLAGSNPMVAATSN